VCLIWAEIDYNRLVVVNPFIEIVLLYFSMQLKMNMNFQIACNNRIVEQARAVTG